MQQNKIQSDQTLPIKVTQEPTSSSKKKYEYIWKGLFLFTVIAGAILLNKLYIFQTHDHFKDIRAGNITEMLIYGLPFAALFTLFDLLVHYIFDQLCYKYYITNDRYLQPQSRKKRCYTLVKWGYSIIYYLLSSAWAYKILRETSFMPTWLGGQGDPTRYYIYLPKVHGETLQMKIFYILQFGKHFSRFFGHCFIRPEGNFFQYALHHGLSVFLIGFSYLSNQWLIGIFVLLIHDYSDFALIIARAYKDYKNFSKKILDLIYVHGMISWISCRIVLFIYCCIYSGIQTILNSHEVLTQFQMGVLRLPYIFMTIMMILLQVLHLFWTYYIAESFVSVKIKNKTKHIYD